MRRSPGSRQFTGECTYLRRLRMLNFILAGPTVEIVFRYRNQRTLANRQGAASVIPVPVLPRLAFTPPAVK